MANYAFKSELPEPVGGVVEGHNLTRAQPHTAIYVGYSGLIFRRCNMTNCDVPGDAVIESGLRGHVSYCSHVHPTWVDRGIISACVENCSHVTDYDTITIDGISVDTNYSYKDEVVS